LARGDGKGNLSLASLSQRAGPDGCPGKSSWTPQAKLFQSPAGPTVVFSPTVGPVRACNFCERPGPDSTGPLRCQLPLKLRRPTLRGQQSMAQERLGVAPEARLLGKRLERRDLQAQSIDLLGPSALVRFLALV
jgi:hypothetical protein